MFFQYYITFGTDSEVLKHGGKIFRYCTVEKRHIFQAHALRFGSKAMREIVYIQSVGVCEGCIHRSHDL